MYLLGSDCKVVVLVLPPVLVGRVAGSILSTRRIGSLWMRIKHSVSVLSTFWLQSSLLPLAQSTDLGSSAFQPLGINITYSTDAHCKSEGVAANAIYRQALIPREDLIGINGMNFIAF